MRYTMMLPVCAFFVAELERAILPTDRIAFIVAFTHCCAIRGNPGERVAGLLILFVLHHGAQCVTIRIIAAT
jgi:hypothetical protein